MEYQIKLSDLAVLSSFLFGTYLFILGIYRLFLSPLAAYPGPRLAALSNWYEFYYDVFLQGKFTFHIQDLHKKYGPIIRITPTELHIHDPDYHEVLYSRTGQRDKYLYFSGRFGHNKDLFLTAPHNLHRIRRKALNPMFSIKKISEFEPAIREKVSKLCHKISEYQEGEVLCLDRAWMALTTDVIAEYSYGRSWDHLDSPGFRDTLHEALRSFFITGHLSLHFPLLFPVLNAMPDWILRAIKPEVLPVVGFKKDLARQVTEIRKGINESHKSVAHSTIFHELINSNLPAEEKSDARLGDEAQLIIAAGLITTSWALSVTSFHIIDNPSIHQKLVAELNTVKDIDTASWQTLEKLPYLNACVHEGIRLSHGTATRSPRLARDQELVYGGGWVIKRGTPVSMTHVHVLMDERVFIEPGVFRPERWLENGDGEGGKGGLEKYFVPFGKGGRACIGINLAQAELYIALASVFSKFEFELFETDLSDVEMAHAYVAPYPKMDSKGVRVTVKAV